MLPKFILAVISLTIFLLLARVLRKLSKKVLSKIFNNITIAQVFSSFIFYAIFLTGFFTALSILELDKAVTSLLAGAGVIGLALSFAFQDLATNFISGFFITVQKPFQVGDYVETNGYAGFITKISLRTVNIKDLDGQVIIIPSKDIFQTPLTNYSKISYRRINLEVGVSYDEDLEFVKEIAIDAIKNITEVDKRRNIKVHYHSFGDSSVNFILRFWIKDSHPNFYNDIISKAVIVIKKAFDKNNIMIPFPIRTLDFGIKGGEKLSEMLKNKNE